MYTARNRNAMITDDSFQIHDWLRSNGNNDQFYGDHNQHLHRVRSVSPIKRFHRIFGINISGNGKGGGSSGVGPDHRRQLKSMDSLLGLSDEHLNYNLNSKVITRASPDVQDSLDRALMDFEETLALAFQSNSIVSPPKGFSNHNLDHDELNGNRLDSSIESSYTNGSSGYSTKQHQPSSTIASIQRSFNTFNELQLIREQMIESLEIIKDLEEQVKLVPKLKAQLATLNTDKENLVAELAKQKQYIENEKKITKADEMNKRRSTKDVGVNCVPIYRDIGVTTPQALTTDTQITFTVAENLPTVSLPLMAISTVSVHTQTTEARKITMIDAAIQSSKTVVRTASVGIMAKPRTYDAGVSARSVTKQVGCTANIKIETQQVERVEEIKPTAVARPVARTTQTEPEQPRTLTVGRTTQTELRSKWLPCSRTTQTEISLTPMTKRLPITKTTQTDPSPQKVPIGRASQTDSAVHRVTKIAITQTDQPNAQRVIPTIGRRSNSFHHYPPATQLADHTLARSEGVVTAASSKIPRLKSLTPELNRKVYTRQDTYTKSAPEVVRQPIDIIKHMDSIPSSPPEVSSKKSSEPELVFKPIRDELSKENPSREMMLALKILNDSLKKTSTTLLPRAQLKHAIDIVREEWFRVSSLSECGVQKVQNYLNTFKSYSPILLEFIINMTDAAGNTVLHYAISHGNFDVVSAVLDTGVCNVDLTNDAGYSSVMLVSLTEIKNSDQMKVIKRLFKCGDVNMQAKKHGQTTLMLAVSHGKTDVVKLLLECGADVNIQDEDGSTALMCAAEHGLQDIVNILLTLPECDVSIADNDGSTALSIAMEAGHREIGIGLYAKQHLVIRENSPFHLSKSKRSRSANTVMISSSSPSSYSSLKKSLNLQPRQYSPLPSMMKTRTP